LYSKNCTKIAPTFLPAIQKALFEGVSMGFSLFLQGLKQPVYPIFSPQFSPQFFDLMHLGFTLFV
jgi:hypothetical protein